jgi:acyl carrier protein
VPDLQVRFLEVLRNYLTLVDPVDTIPPDVPLSDLGLDSMSAIELVLHLEDEFAVVFPDDMLQPPLFRSAQVLQCALEDLLPAAASAAPPVPVDTMGGDHCGK